MGFVFWNCCVGVGFFFFFEIPWRYHSAFFISYYSGPLHISLARNARLEFLYLRMRINMHACMRNHSSQLWHLSQSFWRPSWKRVDQRDVKHGKRFHACPFKICYTCGSYLGSCFIKFLAIRWTNLFSSTWLQHSPNDRVPPECRQTLRQADTHEEANQVDTFKKEKKRKQSTIEHMPASCIESMLTNAYITQRNSITP